MYIQLIKISTRVQEQLMKIKLHFNRVQNPYLQKNFEGDLCYNISFICTEDILPQLLFLLNSARRLEDLFH